MTPGGLLMYEWAPSARSRSVSSSVKVAADRITTGILSVAGSSCKSASIASPPMSGRSRSRRTRSGCSCRASSSPRAPSRAVSSSTRGRAATICSISSTLAGLSSTQRTRTGAGVTSSCPTTARRTGADLIFTASPRAAGADEAASSTTNVEPAPRVLRTLIRPPIASIIPRETASPSPVPSTVDCSAPRRSNGLNRRSIMSGAIPEPSSCTSIRTRPPSLGARGPTRDRRRSCT